MTVSPPNFSPFPFERLPRVSRDQAAIESALARWLAAFRTRPTEHLASLLGPLCVRSAQLADRAFDPYAAFTEVRLGTLAIVVAGSGTAVRAIAQRLLGGMAELPASRSPTVADQAVWSLVVAAALADLGINADVWPLAESAKQPPGPSEPRASANEWIGRGGLISDAPPTSSSSSARDQTVAGKRSAECKSEDAFALARTNPATPPTPKALPGVIPIELSVELAGIAVTAVAWCPAELLLRAPPPRPVPTWAVELPIVVARCALEQSAVQALAVRDVIVVEAGLELRIGDGALGLSAPPGGVEARVAIEYRARDMALPDAAHLELTVRLGSVQMSLRRVGELAVGEVIGLGKPLAGPYEIYADGRAIGTGELVDLDGEVGVRIVSLSQE